MLQEARPVVIDNVVVQNNAKQEEVVRVDINEFVPVKIIARGDILGTIVPIMEPILAGGAVCRCPAIVWRPVCRF